MIITINEFKKTIPKELFFIRHTSNPQADLERGFSCEVNSWVQTEEEAIEFQNKNHTITKPKYDSFSKMWCADPELGLSSFSFSDEKSFNYVMMKMEQYAYDEKIALFKSNDFDLDVGADSEDIFRNGKFIKYINFKTKFNEL